MKTTLLNLFLSVFLSSTLYASPACERMKQEVQEGDIIFIEIGHAPFTQVAESTQSWTSHTGILFKDGEQWTVYESTIPTSKKTEACKYLGRSKNERYALIRYSRGLSARDVLAVKNRATELLGIFYHTGFDFDDHKQFCSKFVYDAYRAIGIEVGQIVTFRQMFDAIPAGATRDRLETFWNRWFYAALRFSGIPWERRTVTPASQLNDPKFKLVSGRREI